MLSQDQLVRFATDGYLLVSGAVEERYLVPLDQEIDRLLESDPPPAGISGPHNYFLPPERLPAADAALRVSGALELARQLVAPRPLDHGLDHIQLALNFPTLSHRPGGPHLDGHRPEQAEPDSFSLLAGIYLVDDAEIDVGNLWVWPGSHLIHSQVFEDRGPHCLLATSGHVTLLDDPPPLGPGTPVIARRGDLVLAHFLLGHNWSGNQASRVRRIAYYRLSCEAHRQRWAETFLDPWAEYEPVRRVAATGAV